tara:strand:- start:253 stop:861 length:609 start_codon:yes stop_codon:yes gene_type:complete
MPTYKKYPFKDYDEYKELQVRRARRSRRSTLAHQPLRHLAIEKLKKYVPDVKSILSIGSRADVDVQDFRDGGYDADGIDLIPGNIVHKGDATRLFEHEYFKHRQYDAFISVHSLEHIWDIDRFRSESLKKCNKVFMHLGRPVDLKKTQPGRWDCVVLDFHDKEITEADRKARLEEFFPGFKAIEAKIITVFVPVVYFLLAKY